MSWRSGSGLFIDIWPAIRRHMPEREQRIEFTAELLKLFVENDMDAWDVEPVHADVREALRRAGIGVAEPDLYDDDSGDADEDAEADDVAPASRAARATGDGCALALGAGVVGFVVGVGSVAVFSWVF